MFQIAGLPKFVCPQTIYGLRPRRRKMTLDTSIEAAGATVIETQPIPSNKNAGEHEHRYRGRNGTPFHQFAAAIPGRHELSSTDYGIR
jgi:predicted nuclease with RNAse H fold